MMNKKLLISGADYFSVVELNPYSQNFNQPDKNEAKNELSNLKQLLISIGVEVVQVASPPDCQDGIYVANWGLNRGSKILLSNLPNVRQPEQAHAKRVLKNLGYQVFDSPYKFSGQGDALPCGNLVFLGQQYRTDPRMKQIIEDVLGYQVVQLQTVPLLDDQGRQTVNSLSGWPDSFYYDIDLAMAIIRPDLIAWCPGAFTDESQQIIRSLDINKIEIPEHEAKDSFACNLVSTGQHVIMSSGAPILQSRLENSGITVHTPKMQQISKGGGYIRCVTLTLDN